MSQTLANPPKTTYIKLKKSKRGKRSWDLTLAKGNRKDIEIELDLLQFSLTNKYEVVKSLFEEMDELVPKFGSWYYELFKSYINSEYNAEIIQESVEKFKQFATEYVNKKDIDFSSFVNYKKRSKTSIIFEVEDIKAIAIASTCLKLYSPFCYDSQLKVPDNIHKAIYNEFVSDCIELKTTDKIFQLVRARNFKSSITDRYMWSIIQMAVLETPETNAMNVFNFMLTNLIALLDVTVNPVFYLVKVADDSVRWMMREIYKERIIYGEALGGTDDIYGSSVSRESFHIFCCNDVIAKCASAGLKVIEDEYDLDEDKFLDLKDKLESIKYIDPSMKFFTLPLLSKVLHIPFNYLLTASPKHIVLMGVLVYHIAEDILSTNYPNLSEFLLTYPNDENSMIVKSSYKMRDIESIIESKDRIFGFKSVKLKYEIFSPICGILSASKKNLNGLMDENKLSRMKYSDLEGDVFKFYGGLYNDSLNDMFKIIEDRVDKFI